MRTNVFSKWYMQLTNTEFFDQEVVRIICTTSTINLDNYSRVALMPVPMVARLLFERAKIPRTFKGRLSYQGRIFPIIHQTIEFLHVDRETVGEEEQLRDLRALCTAAAHHLQARHLFGKLGLTPLSNDMEKPTVSLNSVLTAAVCVGNATMVDALLRSGVDPNIQSDLFGVPLDVAARNGDNKTLLILLGCGAKLYYYNLFNGTRMRYYTLEAAALAGHEHTVRQLLGSRYAIDRSCAEYANAITSAARGGHRNLVRLMLKRADTLDQTELRYEVLFVAAANGHAQLLRMMLEDDTDGPWCEINQPTQYDKVTPLQMAALHGHVDVVRMLVANGADVHYAVHESALNRAASNGHEEVVRILLDAGAYINAASLKTTPLGAAAANGEVSMMRYLLNRGADVDAHKCGEEALFLAAGKGYELVAQLLVEAGVNPNGPGPQGKNPTLQALIAGKCRVVKTLEGLGAEKVDPASSIYAAQFASGRFPYVMYKD